MLILPGLTHVPFASGIVGWRLHSNPGAHSPALYVGGQKHDPQLSPSFLSSRIYFIHIYVNTNNPSQNREKNFDI